MVLSLGFLLPMGSRAADIEWEPDVYPHGNLFPAFLIGTARVDLSEELFAAWGSNHIGDPQGIIGVTLSGAVAGSKIEVVVRGNDYMAESRLKATLDEDAEDLLIHPKIAFNYNALAKVSQAVPLAITVDGKSLGDGQVEGSVKISGGEISKTAQWQIGKKSSKCQGLALSDGLAILTPAGLSVFTKRGDSLEGQSVTLKGKICQESLIPAN